MNLFEIFASANTIVATNRFEKELSQHRDITDRLNDFLKFRLTASPTESFSKKDYPYSGPLAGYRHVHLIYGKIILTYQLVGGQIRLCCLTSHKEVDAKEILARWLNSLKISDYHPFAIPEEVPQESFSVQERAEIIALFYELAAEERTILEDGYKGDISGIMDYIDAYFVNGWTKKYKETALLAAFNGADNLKKTISEILRNTKPNATALAA
jgi:mRNA-degrading endonuclease YafQ of YafQ-DinJ toxin-antitoxin module